MPFNGNKVKGNKLKKSSKGHDQYADYDPTTDRYAVVVDRKGGKHIKVQPIDNKKGDTVMATIPGRFYKRGNWFYSGDYVVITYVTDNISEIKGRIKDSELGKIKHKFEKMSEGDDIVKFKSPDDEESEENNNESEDDSNQDFENEPKKKQEINYDEI